MKKHFFINIKNKDDASCIEYRADKELADKIVNEIASQESFQNVMKELSDK